jgi:hypothetical protein
MGPSTDTKTKAETHKNIAMTEASSDHSGIILTWKLKSNSPEKEKIEVL